MSQGRVKWFGETHFWDSEWKWCAFPGFQIVAFMRFLDFEPVLALLLAIAPCIPAILAARLVQAEFEGLWKSHHARRALAACCSMLVVIFGEEWVFRLTMILTETVQGHGDFAQRLLDPSTPYAIIFPLMLELPSALYPWKSLGSRSGEISERLSRGISVFFLRFSGCWIFEAGALYFNIKKLGAAKAIWWCPFCCHWPRSTGHCAWCKVQPGIFSQLQPIPFGNGTLELCKKVDHQGFL